MNREPQKVDTTEKNHILPTTRHAAGAGGTFTAKKKKNRRGENELDHVMSLSFLKFFSSFPLTLN